MPTGETEARPATRSVPQKLERLLSRTFQTKLIRYLYARHVTGFSIPHEPYFASEEAVAWFSSKLARSKMYLEFGSGGSTFLAASYKVPFISVESDKRFLADVRSEIAVAGLLDEAHQTFVHRDIGPTKGFGKPLLLGTPGAQRRTLFKAYSDFPELELAGRSPDLVLVDGRFRVACALKALRALKSRTGWTLLVDDYSGRPHFKAIEQFGKFTRYVGRMAVFEGCEAFSDDALNAAITRFEGDYR